MDLNFIKSIVIIEWLEKYDLKRLNSVKTIAQVKGKKFKGDEYIKYKIIRGNELAKSTNFSNLPVIEKSILISNFILPDDEQFVAAVRNYGWTEEKTIELNNLIKKLLVLRKRNDLEKYELDLTLLEDINRISKNILGVSYPTIFINRLNDINVTKKELFNEKHNKKIKKY